MKGVNFLCYVLGGVFLIPIVFGLIAAVLAVFGYFD
jgi:hypothetical protein